MKSQILALTLLGCSLLTPLARSQPRSLSRGLGLSDADWKKSLGTPAPFGRDGWLYRGRWYTRSWARAEAPRGHDWNGYIEADCLVKEIEIVWGPKNRVSFAKARAEALKLLPPDAKPVTKSYRTSSKTHRYYSSEFLATRLMPGMAGDNYCVTPWGYAVGKLRIAYHFVRGRVSRVVIDVGEPHETSLDVCKHV